MELKPMLCTQCGAPLKDGYCSYCGVDYWNYGIDYADGQPSQFGVIPMTHEEFQKHKKLEANKEFEEANAALKDRLKEANSKMSAMMERILRRRTLSKRLFGRKAIEMNVRINGDKFRIVAKLIPGVRSEYEPYIVRGIDKTIQQLLEDRFACLHRKDNCILLQNNILYEFTSEFIHYER